MVEVYEIEGHGKGLKVNSSALYDETIIVNLAGNQIIINTGSIAEGDHWWNVCLNKDEAKAIIRHMAKLIRDMD
jgi:hypothetical protein